MTSQLPDPGARGGLKGQFVIGGRHVIGAFVAFFLVVLAVNSLMIWYAVTTFGGLDTKDAYRKGLEYNRTIAEANAQDSRGWRDSVRFAPAGDLIEAVILGPDGRGVDGLEVVARIGRPATTGFDRTLVLKSEGEGRYSARAADLAPGNWIASIEARQAGSKDDAIFRSKARIWKEP